jgi:hypothetical protein
MPFTNNNLVRIYSEITNSNNFKRIERRIPIGNTLIYIIFALDDTRLSSHSGHATARPLYLTLGNISNKARKALNRHAWSLVALLPIMAHKKSRSSLEKMQFNHYTLGIVLDTLIEAERSGIDIACSDQIVRRCNLVPAQCVVDLMEAYTLAGITSHHCAKCLVSTKEMNNFAVRAPLRSSEGYKDHLLEAWETGNIEAIKYYSRQYNVSPILVGQYNALSNN